jgi:hypothetical protein
MIKLLLLLLLVFVIFERTTLLEFVGLIRLISAQIEKRAMKRVELELRASQMGYI